MIAKANALWDERNVQAVQDGLEELPRMLPLVRLKVIHFYFRFHAQVHILSVDTIGRHYRRIINV